MTPLPEDPGNFVGKVGYISVEGCSVRGLTPLPLVHAGYAAPRYFPSPWILHGLHPPQLFLSDY